MDAKLVHVGEAVRLEATVASRCSCGKCASHFLYLRPCSAHKRITRPVVSVSSHLGISVEGFWWCFVVEMKGWRLELRPWSCRTRRRWPDVLWRSQMGPSPEASCIYHSGTHLELSLSVRSWLERCPRSSVFTQARVRWFLNRTQWSHWAFQFLLKMFSALLPTRRPVWLCQRVRVRERRRRCFVFPAPKRQRTGIAAFLVEVGGCEGC